MANWFNDQIFFSFFQGYFCAILWLVFSMNFPWLYSPCFAGVPRLAVSPEKKNRRLRHWLVVGGIFVLVRIHAHDTEGVLKRQRGSPGPIAGLPKRLWLVKLVMVIWPYLKNLWPYLGYDSLSMAICSMYVFYSPTKLGHLLR